MSSSTSPAVDDYLAAVEEPKRSTLDALRRTILELVPEAEEGISYGMPAYRVRGTTIAGFAAFSKHLSYLPHSGSVISELGDAVAGYESTKGSLHFAVDRTLPRPLVAQLLRARLAAAGIDAEVREATEG